MMFLHTTINVDGRCLDLLMTEEEVAKCFERCMEEENQKFISTDKCCSCWPANKPPECGFWGRILGICRECDQ